MCMGYHSTIHRAMWVNVEITLRTVETPICLLQQFALFARSSLEGTNEVEIYSKLLDFEYDRLSTERQEVKTKLSDNLL